MALRVEAVSTSGETTKIDARQIRAEKATRPPRPILTVLGGLERGRPIVPESEPTVLGRDGCSGIRLDGSGLSREHARLEVGNDGELFIFDLGSTNGTFVNGEMVERVRLHAGDVVQLGPEVKLAVDFDDAAMVVLRRRSYEQSIRDELTGLYNRRHFDTVAESELAYARRHDAALALIAMDLDHFKRVNDTYGHHAGDQVLKHVASMLCEHFRIEDLVARIGGEEFAILLRSSTAEGAMVCAQRLRERIANSTMRWAGPDINVTASLGLATGGGADFDSVPALLAVADSRLYAAKDAGRNRVV